MRISDWSSDVCSSDLGSRRESSQGHAATQDFLEAGAGPQNGRQRPVIFDEALVEQNDPIIGVVEDEAFVGRLDSVAQALFSPLQVADVAYDGVQAALGRAVALGADRKSVG